MVSAGAKDVASAADTDPASTVDMGTTTSESICPTIHQAVSKQDRRSVAYHLQRQPECVMHLDEEHRTPLLLAAANGDCTTLVVLIRRMLTHNTDALNWADAAGLTPLASHC